MNPKWQRLIFGLVILMVAGLTIGQLSFTAAQGSLKTDAGHDKTVEGLGPVSMAFSGTANIEDYTCNWFNQWGQLRAGNECFPIFDVHFGKNPKVRTKRTFTLEVTDTHGATRHRPGNYYLGAVPTRSPANAAMPRANHNGQRIVSLSRRYYHGLGTRLDSRR